MVTTFLLSLNNVLPIFLMVAVGWLLKRAKIVDKQFITTLSKLFYYLLLPSLIFSNVVNADFSELFEIKLIAIGVLLQFTMIFIAGVVLKFHPLDRATGAAFKCGSYWGNLIIIGFVAINNLLGEEYIPTAAIMATVLLISHNVIAVALFSEKREVSPIRHLFEILLNPLVIVTIVALPFSLSPLLFPGTLKSTVESFSRASLPMALIAVGGTIQLSNKRYNLLALKASLLKTVVMPALALLFALLLGYRGGTLAVFYILMASPVAISYFNFIRAMNHNSDLAASIVAISLLTSLFSMSIGVSFLRTFNLI